jgi:hypothetical protein
MLRMHALRATQTILDWAPSWNRSPTIPISVNGGLVTTWRPRRAVRRSSSILLPTAGQIIVDWNPD